MVRFKQYACSVLLFHSVFKILYSKPHGKYQSNFTSQTFYFHLVTGSLQNNIWLCIHNAFEQLLSVFSCFLLHIVSIENKKIRCFENSIMNVMGIKSEREKKSTSHLGVSLSLFLILWELWRYIVQGYSRKKAMWKRY